MLNLLSVKNVALIDELEVTFSQGLNILSGETGAGKSIVIDSLNFVLGERPGKDFIRNGQASASVEAFLTISGEETLRALKKLDVDISEATENGEMEILLSRTIQNSGKSICKINGRTVTNSMLKEASALFVDVHGQHEHQSLLNATHHIELLDRFCGDEAIAIKTELAMVFKKYKEANNEIKNIEGENKGDREEKIELYTYQINEIESAKLKKEEEEELIEARKLLSHAEKLSMSAENALDAIYRGGKNTQPALDLLWIAFQNVKNIAEIDVSAISLCETIESLYMQADEWVRDLRQYSEDIEHEPEELEKIDERLDLIYKLKKKYGATINDILEHCNKTNEKLDFLVSSEEQLEKLNEEKKTLGKEAMHLCQNLSDIRKRIAVKLGNEIVAVLSDLGMKNASFSIVIDKKDGFGLNGYDKVEFMISPNPGEPNKPLSKIASGGEMSRVMLALKTVLADSDEIGTFIFDEIDTGVSGRTAQQVAEKLSFIGSNKQILCITHLPQIAAMGDSHFFIEKTTDNKHTKTSIKPLDEFGITMELARLIGGAEITNATKKAASEMKEQANKLKSVIRQH